MFAFFTIYSKKQVSFLFQIVIPLSKFSSASTFYHFVLLMLYNMSERSFKVKFLPTSLPWGCVHPFCHNHFSRLWSKAPFTKFLCCLESLSKVSQHSHSHIFPSHLCLIWTPALLLSIIFLSCFHLWSIHFCKLSHVLITEIHGVITMTALLSVHELVTHNMGSNTSPKGSGRRKVTGCRSQCASTIYAVICDWRTSSEWSLYFIQ